MQLSGLFPSHITSFRVLNIHKWIKKRSGYRQSLLMRAMEMLPLSHGNLSRLMDCLGRIRLEEIVSVQ